MSDSYKQGWNDAMSACSDLIGQMVRWDHSAMGVYETYEIAFSEVATDCPPGTSGIEIFKAWVSRYGR